MVYKLRPYKSDDEERLPLGFQAGENLAAGDTYTGPNGEFVSARELNTILADVEPGAKRVIRVPIQYRMPNDPVDKPLRNAAIVIPVVGGMDAESLGRAIHAGIRQFHAMKRRQKRNG